MAETSSCFLRPLKFGPDLLPVVGVEHLSRHRVTRLTLDQDAKLVAKDLPGRGGLAEVGNRRQATSSKVDLRRPTHPVQVSN